VARLIVLDAGPLGLACSRPGTPAVDACHAWLLALEAGGAEILVPTVADYEVRRELIRLRATTKLRNLDDLAARFDLVDIGAKAFRRAAEYWAHLRQGGLPTSGTEDLDADALLAGLAATIGKPGDVVTIATTNVRHLGRFPGIEAREWSKIV
jgi:predicted nucleic acid-binding protein